jgi:phage shock protein A
MCPQPPGVRPRSDPRRAADSDEGMVAPMGVMKRVQLVFRAKANKALDRMEDPRETLDYSYQQQLELLQKVRRGVADVATSRKRIELQVNQLQQSSDKLTRQAQDSLAAGREDLAREALGRKAGIQTQLTDLQGQYASLQAEEEKLTSASQRLQAKVDAFRTRKETIKATYTAAEAQTRISEAFTGISEEMSDVGMAIQRAEDKTEQLKARAGAMDELMASGALEDMVSGPRDDIQAELDRMGASSSVDHELEQMKAELTANAPKELEGGTQAEASSAGAAGTQAGASSVGAAGTQVPDQAGDTE